MEKRLIDANALFELLKEQREKETGAYSKGRNNGINVAIGAIRNEQICPTVDAVEVVRCKDCYFSERANVNGVRICHYWSPFKEALVPNDGFCYRGERKDNG